MASKKDWILKFYFFFILVLLIRKTKALFSPNSEEHLYFEILSAFHPLLIFTFLLKVIQLVVNFFNCIPLYCAIDHKKFLTPVVWRILFCFKLVFDIFGQPYEMKELSALYHGEPKTALLAMAIGVFIYLPWYLIIFQYAFKEKIFLAKS
ncbi:MAG: hypothetical protein HQL24_07195 [Candidatus Omnitrophica bacterium]|nr:hypothetical protein [Candidatus Omnitrophota bacterium]